MNKLKKEGNTVVEVKIMYAYQKKTNHKKGILLGSGFALLVLLCGFALFFENQQPSAPILKEEELVISLPKKEVSETSIEEIIAPFQGEASIVLEYYDGTQHEVKDYTELSGIFRPNQGIDYAENGESFDVIAMVSGVVSEVKQDEMFGNSITVKSNGLEITYQSLDALNYQVNDEIKQKEVIGKASTNAYNPDLGNHLHVVVMQNGKLCDPKSIIGKTTDALE